MDSQNTKSERVQVNPIIARAAAYVQRNTWKRAHNPDQLELPVTPARRHPDGHQNY